MKKLTLSIPGYGEITPPPNIPSGADAPSNILQFSVNLLSIAVVIAAVIFVLWGGILWITSQGDKAKVDKARHTIMYAIIGVVIMILAFIIIQIIGTLLGVSYLAKFGTN